LSDTPLRILIIRHAETEWNRLRRVQGVSDIPLNERGVAQAEALGHRLAVEPLRAIYSSPLLRARQTAEAIARTHGIAVEILPGIAEFNQGTFEGKAFGDLIVEHADLLAAFAKDPADVRIPGGETMAEVQVRAWNAFTGILSRHETGSVAMVGHNMTNLALLCRFLGMELSRFRRLTQSSTGLTILERGVQGLYLRLLNDLSHLPEDLRPEPPTAGPDRMAAEASTRAGTR
jgi:broad specificity phosphatase PhoE